MTKHVSLDEDVLKTSSVFWRRMSKVNIFVLMKTSSEDEDQRCLQNVFKTSSSRRMFVGSILRAYITVYNFDFICLSETYLDSSILHDDDNLQIPGYIIYIGKIILWIFNEEVLVFTTTFLFHFKLKMSITCRNALILK